MISKAILSTLDIGKKEASGKIFLDGGFYNDQDRIGMKQELYNRYSGEYERRTEGGLILFQRELDLFSNLTQGGKIIDLGSGPGRDAIYLQKKGTYVLCCDFSLQMLDRCSAKGLETRLMNYEAELGLFPDSSLDGLWTNCSLTTTPESKIEIVLKEIYRILKPNSPAFFGFIEGDFREEGGISPDRKYELPRFRFRANRKQIKDLIEKSGLKMINFGVVPKEISGKNTYLKYLCTKLADDSRL